MAKLESREAKLKRKQELAAQEVDSEMAFQYDVQYDDGERKFEGRGGFGDHTYIRDNVQDAKAAVTTMRVGERVGIVVPSGGAPFASEPF